MSYLSKNFHRSELECPCCKEINMSQNFIDALQRLRNAMDMPFVITSGFRCPKHNREIKGSRNSRHKRGLAVDISTLGWQDNEIFKFLKLATNKDTFLGQQTGVGIYPKHFHFDIRNRSSAWVSL